MAFHILENADITKFIGDVIVNSVGVTSHIHGGVCGAILKVTNSSDLKKIIDGVNDVYSVGEYFTTEGYGLASNHIFHLITPNYENDKKLILLKECLRRIFNECQYRGWYKVGIPLLGCGANGYKRDDVASLIEEIARAYCSLYPNMKIYLVLPDENTNLTNKARIKEESYREDSPHDPKTNKKFKKGAKFIDSHSSCADDYGKDYFLYERFANGDKDILLDRDDIRDIDDYVTKYCSTRSGIDILYPTNEYLTNRINTYFGYGKKSKDTYTHAGSDAYGEIKYENNADKKYLFRLVLALKMSYKEAQYFLNYFGCSFSRKGINKVDDVIRTLIENKQYGIVEAELEFAKNKISKYSIFKKQ